MPPNLSSFGLLMDKESQQVAQWPRIRLPVQETQETWVRSLDRGDLLKEEMATHSSILAWESHGQRSLVGYSPGGRKEMNTTEVT